MTISGPPEDIASVGLVAGRIRRFAEAIIQGHQLGIAPGGNDEPWTIDLQRQAVPIYSVALSWEYLTRLASGFEVCANLMVTLGDDFRRSGRLSNDALNQSMNHHSLTKKSTGSAASSTVTA